GTCTSDIPPPPPKDTIDVGTGNDGSLTLDEGTKTMDDVRAALLKPADAGAMSIVVAADPGFRTGDEIAIVQMTGPGAGTYETARVARVTAGELALTKPL